MIRLQTDAGLPIRNGKVYDYVFKAFLTMDAYVLTLGGDPRIREMQQDLNNKYFTTSGVQPCDGHYQRGTNRALIYGIQTEEGISPSLQTGSVGPMTRDRLPTLSLGSSGNFVKLFQYALYVNGFDPGAFDGYATGTSAVAEGFDSAYDAALHLIGHLDETKSRFSMTDFIGDVDAVNIGNMLLNIPQPINGSLRHYYEDRYKVRFSLFFESRFSGDPNLVQSQSTYILTSDEAGMLELRWLFMTAFDTPVFSVEDGKEVARAFKDILVRLSNEE